MKRCRIPSSVLMVLVLASLFIVSGCGIPTYLNLDDNITWKELSKPDNIRIQQRLIIDAQGLNEINEKVDQNEGPGIKFFYTVSENGGEMAYADSSIDVSSLFDTYMKKVSTGNGLNWYTESNLRAPGFYLFTPTNSSIAPLSVERPLNSSVVQSDSDVPLLVGTFSFSPDNENYLFPSSSNMDIPVDRTTGIIDFEIEISQSGTNGEAAIDFRYRYSDEEDVQYITETVRDFRKKAFPFGSEAATFAAYVSDLKSDDSLFFAYLPDSPTSLYLHIWASVFGGRGFTNTYWSELQYLGCIELF